MHLQLDPERLPKLKVWILIPAAGDLIHATFAASLIKLMGSLRIHGIEGQLHFLPGDSLVTRARNNLADIFLSESSDPENHLSLWLDCDILFDPESVLQLIALNLDFVTAPYTRKGLHNDRIAEAARLNWPNEKMMATAGTPNVNWLVHPIRLDQPMPVLEAGSGFWLVKRKVYEQLIASGGAPKFRRAPEERTHYGRDHAHDFFRVGVWPETGEYLSEDWWFCREWRKAGGTVYCCFWMKTHHIGNYMYPMDMAAIADLLTATGGYINAETKPKETPNAPTQVRSSSPNNGIRSRTTDPSGSFAIAGVLDAIRAEADQTASPCNPSPVGGGSGL